MTLVNAVAPALGQVLHQRIAELYPICRSITGDGVRQTLQLIGQHIPLEERSVKSGTRVFDWTINDEWNVRDAYIADLEGRRLVDFRAHNLHLVSYSIPVRARLSFEELRPHLHTLPEHPDWIPYRTTYYSRTWGFCLAHSQLESLGPGPFDVVIDTSLTTGELSYGELVISGDGSEEVILSAHVCHPSLANDNLSGIAIATELAKSLLTLDRRRYTYRFLFAPGTIGSLAWLSQHPDVWPRIRHGLVLTGLAGSGKLVYKQTRHGSRPIDRVAAHVVERGGGEIRPYSPYGYDERQFNSVGFDLPVGRLSRTPHGEYPEYHTSADNLDFVRADELAASYAAVREIIDILERDQRYRNRSPYGEPQLGKRGLYPTIGGKAASDAVMAMLWTLAYSDGEHSLLDIAEVSSLPFPAIHDAASKLAGAAASGTRVMNRRLILLRHAGATDTRPGGRDIDRELTPLGERQARAAGDFLRDSCIEVDAVICSAAVRARQTLEWLGLPVDPTRVQVSQDYYNAGTDTLLDALRALPDDCAVALLVGHAPGVPGVAFELADPQVSDHSAMEAIAQRFPAAAIAQLEFAGAWPDLDEAKLVSVRFPVESELSRECITDC